MDKTHIPIFENTNNLELEALNRIAVALERYADAMQNSNFFTLLAMGVVKGEDVRTQAILARTAQGVFDHLQEQHEREALARETMKAMNGLKESVKQ